MVLSFGTSSISFVAAREGGRGGALGRMGEKGERAAMGALMDDVLVMVMGEERCLTPTRSVGATTGAEPTRRLSPNA